MILLSGALFMLVWGIIKTETLGWGSATAIGFLLGFVALLAVWVARMRTAKEPLVPLSLFRSASFDTGLGIMAAVAFALFGVIFFVTLYLQRVQGYSPVSAGVRMLPLTGVIAVSSVIGGVLGGRVPLRGQLRRASCSSPAACSAWSGSSRTARRSVPLWLWFALIGLGLGQVFTTAAEVIVAVGSGRARGHRFGLQQTLLQVGGALGTAVLGSILTSPASAR